MIKGKKQTDVKTTVASPAQSTTDSTRSNLERSNSTLSVASTSLESDGASPIPILHKTDTQETLRYEDYYQGGYSQWREYETESAWNSWDWPPAGWRPSEFQNCYWDESSKYYRYNNVQWGSDNSHDRHTPEPTKVDTPPEAYADTYVVRGQSFLDEQLQRCKTGDQEHFQNQLEQVPTSPSLSPNEILEQAKSLMEMGNAMRAALQEEGLKMDEEKKSPDSPDEEAAEEKRRNMEK